MYSMSSAILLFALTISRACSALSPGSALDKRAEGCNEISLYTTDGSYETEGIVFDILCNTSFSFRQYSKLIYTNFTGCMNDCTSYPNTSCVGVEYHYGLYGPSGPTGGSACYLLWTLGDNSTGQANETLYDFSADSAVRTSKVSSVLGFNRSSNLLAGPLPGFKLHFFNRRKFRNILWQGKQF